MTRWWYKLPPVIYARMSHALEFALLSLTGWNRYPGEKNLHLQTPSRFYVVFTTHLNEMFT
jgi:hypothetical protein